MARELTRPAPLSLVDFDEVFESVKNWGRWGPDDQLGTLNYITPDKVQAAARLVRSGRSVSMAIPINKTAGPDNPDPPVHLLAWGHDIDPGAGGMTFATCYLGMISHGDCHTHVDALNHIAYKGQLFNGKPAAMLTSRLSTWGGIDAYANGILGRGVLLDAARHRNVRWLEPGEAVNSQELRAIERAEGVTVGEGDILVFRTGHHARRLALGPWNPDYPPAGEGRAGLDVDAIPWMHERKVAAFLPDGDGETVPSGVQGMPLPIHPLQITAMGLLASDSLNLEDVAKVCEAEGRWAFMVVGLPLRLPGATGSAWNPVAIL